MVTHTNPATPDPYTPTPDRQTYAGDGFLITLSANGPDLLTDASDRILGLVAFEDGRMSSYTLHRSGEALDPGAGEPVDLIRARETIVERYGRGLARIAEANPHLPFAERFGELLELTAAMPARRDPTREAAFGRVPNTAETVRKITGHGIGVSFLNGPEHYGALVNSSNNGYTIAQFANGEIDTLRVYELVEDPTIEDISKRRHLETRTWRPSEGALELTLETFGPGLRAIHDEQEATDRAAIWAYFGDVLRQPTP